MIKEKRIRRLHMKGAWYGTGAIAATVFMIAAILLGNADAGKKQATDRYYRGAPDAEIVLEEFSDFT